MSGIRRHPIASAVAALTLIATALVGFLVEPVERYPHLIDR